MSREKLKENIRFLTEIGPRPIGSQSLSNAIEFFSKEFSRLGYYTILHDYPTISWDFKNLQLNVNDQQVSAIPNPFSPSCNIKGKLSFISSLEALKKINKNEVKNKILLLGGDLTKEILFPLNYSFFNISEHQELYHTLNKLSPAAVIFISHSTFNPAPISQDIDFNIPSITVSTEDGINLLEHNKEQITLKIETFFSPSTSSILRGRLNKQTKPKIGMVAHLDTQFFSPGAHDDASGVLCLVEIMSLLKNDPSSLPIEFIITTGHEHTGDGEKLFIDKINEENLDLEYFFNIDGIGHKMIQDQMSFYNIPEELKIMILNIQKEYDISEGPQWPQGLHGVFAHIGKKCFAITSQGLDIHHTSNDTFDLLSISNITRCANLIHRILKIIE